MDKDKEQLRSHNKHITIQWINYFKG